MDDTSANMSAPVWTKQCAGYYFTTDGKWSAELETAQELLERGYERDDCIARWQLARIGDDVTYHNDVRDTYSTFGECKAAALTYSNTEARHAVIAAEHEAAKSEVAA